MSKTTGAQKIGRFEVIRRIGAGGQGTVFEARDPELERPVAIKLIHSDQITADRPPLEGQLMARLRHPNIVSVFEIGVLGSLPYLVFEYVEGVTLKTFISRQQRATVEDACALMMPILAGAAHAHGQGIVHLDLTPGNILIDRDRVPRIMDFGLARALGQPQPVAEHTIGSLRYMSPEHFGGGELGVHTDVFALSLVFFELLTGRPLAAGNSSETIIQQLLGTPDLSALAGDRALKPFSRVIGGGLEHDPGARYTDAAALRAALGEAMKSAGLEITDNESHATVEFFLRRMQRKKDFPGLSRSLADINRLTAEGSNASNEQLSNVILRDYALTKKLLQLANSAFYGGSASREVPNVSQAIRLLGFEQIRMTANSLCYANHLQSQGKNTRLKDAITRSFVSGLIARHLARQAKLPGAEEAFIAGMFRNIGEHLTLYYFPEEHADIEACMGEQQIGLPAAARRVLGITFAELGGSVARAWKLPGPILEVIEASPDGGPLPGAEPEDVLRNLAVFANALCAIPGMDDMAQQDESLRTLCSSFDSVLPFDEAATHRVLESALEKLRQFAPILGINPGRSDFCRDLEQWLAWWRTEARAEAPAHASSA